VDFATPTTSELTWTLTREDGAVFVPTFLPPALLPQGGRPRTQFLLQAGKGRAFANVGGISGFYPQGEATDNGAPLPPGRYEVQVSGVTLGSDAALSAPPVSLTAR
jgi:hypothetical protein